MVSLPATIAPNQSVSLTLNYSLPVESNTGLSAISAVSSQFLLYRFGIQLQTPRLVFEVAILRPSS